MRILFLSHEWHAEITKMAVHKILPMNAKTTAGADKASTDSPGVLVFPPALVLGTLLLSIVTEGPFRFTRNPLYVGGTAAYIGLGLGFNLAWALILLVPMLFLLSWGIIRREERYLEKKFGETYLAYKTRVRRWL